MQRLERADAEIGSVRRNVDATGVDRKLARLADLELKVEAERRGEDVESRTEVR
jgi:hypothetical protein